MSFRSIARRVCNAADSVVPAAVLSALVLVLPGCATQKIELGAEGASADYLRERWVPKTREALERADAYAQKRFGRSAAGGPTIVLVASEEQAKIARQKSPQGLVLNVGSSSPTTRTLRGIVQPTHDAILATLQEAAGASSKNAIWLREGLASMAAYSIADDMRAEGVAPGAWKLGAEYELRNGKQVPNLAEVLQDRVAGPGSKGFDATSAFLVMLLAEQLGPSMEKAGVGYLAASAGRSAQERDLAFERAFGIPPSRFLDMAESRLAALRAVKYEHVDATAVAKQIADAKNSTLVELPTKRLTDGFARYKKEPSPKAFAFSYRGAFAFESDRPDAIASTMRQCLEVEPLGCRLYAIDDDVVLQTPTTPGKIDVLMYNPDKSDWANKVEQTWLPVFKDSAQRFSAVIQNRLGAQLKSDARIFVVADRKDYNRVLREEIGQTAIFAERTAEATAGISNARGKMVAAAFAESREEYRWALATSVTLHELVHELQAQVSNQYEAFRPQRWLTEGTADQIAYLVGQDIPFPTWAKYEIDNWREKCTDWYTLDGLRTTRPRDVLDKNLEEWLKLVTTGKHPYEMSGLMVMHLEDLLGAGYYPALMKYWKLAGTPGQHDKQAFEESFGMSQSAFLESTEKWLKELVSGQ